jgi:hypothetical protein
MDRDHPNGAPQHVRQRNGYGVHVEKAVPVPGYGNGLDRKNNHSHGQPLFDLARSPPTASSKSESVIHPKKQEGRAKMRQIRNTFPASSSVKAPARPEAHVPFLIPWIP